MLLLYIPTCSHHCSTWQSTVTSQLQFFLKKIEVFCTYPNDLLAWPNIRQTSTILHGRSEYCGSHVNSDSSKIMNTELPKQTQLNTVLYINLCPVVHHTAIHTQAFILQSIAFKFLLGFIACTFYSSTGKWITATGNFFLEHPSQNKELQICMTDLCS